MEVLALVVVAAAVAGFLALAARSDGASWRTRLEEAIPGRQPERRDDRWALRSDRYGPLLRRYAPTLVLERDRWGHDHAVPVDVGVCRRPSCAAFGVGVPVAHAHVVDTPAATYLQYWLYYPDSRTTHAPVAQLQGYHRDDWEGVIVRVGDDGSVGARVTAHQGLVGTRPSWVGNPGWRPVAAGPIIYRAAGSHANGFDPGGIDAPLDRWNGELGRVTLRLIPADAAPGLRLRYDPAVSPPWRKALWRNPEAVTTGG